MRQLCLVAAAPQDEALLAEYAHIHEPANIPASTIRALRRSGIHDCRIYKAEDRLIMIIEAEDGFSMQRAAALNAGDEEVQSWNRRIASLLQGSAAAGPLWVEAARLFDLADHPGE